MPLFQAKPKSNTPSVPLSRPKSTWSETGYSGTQFFSGFIHNEEYLRELQWQDGVKIYDRMRRSDGQVKGTLRSIFLPILQAQWYVTPGDDSKEGIQIAYDLEDNLINGKNYEGTWMNTLQQILSYLPFGFSIFEKVYHIVDNRVFLKKLAPRIQKTLYRWLVDDNGNLTGIQQYIIRPQSKSEYIDIPADRLVLFVNEMEGSNFEGVSILRSAYKHWYIKDQLYQVDALGHDRFASGVPYAKEPLNSNPADRARAETILENIYSREKSFAVVPAGWELGILEKAGSNDSILKSIQHHNEEIAKNVLAQFLNLGTTQSGSRSLGESFEELFLMSINAVVKQITDGLNQSVIKELCDYNYNIKDGKYPKLSCHKIMLSPTAFVSGLKMAVDGRMLTTDIDIENNVRGLYGLPLKTEDEELDDENNPDNAAGNDSTGNNTGGAPADDKNTQSIEGEKKKTQPKPQAGAPTDDDTNEDKKMKECACGGKHLREYVRRELNDIEKKCCDIDQIERMFAEGSDRISKVIAKIRDTQIRSVANQALSRDPSDIRVPNVGEMAKAMYEEMITSFDQAQKDLTGELKRQVDRGEIRLADKAEMDIGPLLKKKAKATAVAMANKLVNNALFQIGRIPFDANPNEAEDLLVANLKAGGAKEIERMAQTAANYAYGLGREKAAETNEDDIEYAVYSAVLDGRACEVCLPKDMVVHELDDPEFATPSPDCLGGEGACRCVNIYKMKDMQGDFATKSKEQYEKDKVAVDQGDLDAEDMRARYELPKYKEVIPGEVGFGVGE